MPETKKSKLRIALENTARNLCEPPLLVESMNKMDKFEIMDYIAAHQNEEPRIEQKAIEFTNKLSVAESSLFQNYVGDHWEELSQEQRVRLFNKHGKPEEIEDKTKAKLLMQEMSNLIKENKEF